MVTDIGIFVGEELDEEDLRLLVAGFCDIIVEQGYATKRGEVDSSQAKTFIAAKTYEIFDENVQEFIEGVLDGASLAVIPIDPEQEEE